MQLIGQKAKVNKAKEFVTDEEALFHFLVEQLKALIKVIKPKKSEHKQEPFPLLPGLQIRFLR